MDYNKFSTIYQVKKLIEDDISMIYELCIENEIYYQHCPPFPTYESIKKDMYALPPKKDYNDKYYLGYYKDNVLIAVLDLIDKCPDENTIFIGFFMVNKKYQKKLIGSSIMKELILYIKKLGYKNIRLGCIESNIQSYTFWSKLGFIDTGLRNYNNEYTVKILNKTIY